MKLPFIVLCIFCSCTNSRIEGLRQGVAETTILDSVRAASKAAWILFHHQVQKKSLMSKMVNTPSGIDSLFSYIGELESDTACLHGGSYNYFGQINLYVDTSGKKKVAEMHFVLEGDCAGFYLKREDYLKRYNIKPEGKTFISELFNAKKHLLND